MKSKSASAILLVSALASAPALAADEGGYLGVEFGRSTLKNAAPFPNPSTITVLAGYRFSPTIAAELGYTRFTEAMVNTSFSNYSLNLGSFHPAVVASLPLSDDFKVFGKIGISMNTEDITNNLSGAAFTDKRTSNYYAVGAQYRVYDFGFRVQYENFGMFDNVPPTISASTLSFGLIGYF